jgi:short-subunit dehydrogenase
MNNKEASDENKQLSSFLSGKVSVGIGPTRGIGLAEAKEFTRHNDAEVVICFGRKQRAGQQFKELSGKSYGNKLDIIDISCVEQPLDEIIGVSHRIDILVNDARYQFSSKTWTNIRSELKCIGVLIVSIMICGNVISWIIRTDGRTHKPGEGSKIMGHVAYSRFSFATGNPLVVGG